MILPLIRAFLAALLLTLACLSPVTAQQANEVLPTFGPVQPVAGDSGLDYADWDKVATRAERVAINNVASVFALNRLRAELVTWRDAFGQELQRNAGRLSTLNAQIAALGPAPETGTEDAVITARRNQLESQRDRLAAPGLLAEEAFARANGLISETDAMLRARQADRLLVRGQSPLNPALWGDATGTLWDGVTGVATEASAGVSRDIASGAVWQRAPLVALLFGVGLALLIRGRKWVASFHNPRNPRHPLMGFVLNLGQIGLPLIGLLAITLGFNTADVLGLRSQALVATIPLTGSLIIVARWLAVQFFPAPPNYGPMGYPDATRRRAKRLMTLLAWVTALWLPFAALLDASEPSTTSRAVLTFPVIAVLGFLLFQIGQLIREKPTAEAGMTSEGRGRNIIGRLVQAVAILSPLAAAAGYDTGAQALLFPTIITLGVLGVLVYLQKLVFVIYGLWSHNPDSAQEALVPLLIGFVLVMLALPFLALIWGAQMSDLQEIWARFSAGLQIGETRIAPSNFMTFATVFALGYMLTRFIQGTLRNSVLTRTKLDIGGQNAVVSGFGYVGILISALAAITSAGIDLSSFAIVAGALSLGIGFGLQNIVQNFVSGIILLIERPVSQGDMIEVGGQIGYVRDISVRSTTIETFDRTDVIIPNADLVSGQVTNWTRGNQVGRAILPVGVAYGTDVPKVMAILKDIAEAHPMVVMDPPPGVLFIGFGADSLNFEIRAILRDINYAMVTKSEMNLAIVDRFKAEGIEIPFPQRDIWLRNPEALRQNLPIHQMPGEEET